MCLIAFQLKNLNKQVNWYEQVSGPGQWPNTCLDPSEMIFHTNGAQYIAELNKANGYTIIAFKIVPDILISGYPNPTYPYPIVHTLHIWYAKCDQ